MAREFTFELRSELTARADAVWEHVTTMQGVNEELRPLMTMSAPPHIRARSLSEAPVGETAFVSWLSLLGVLPFDRHAVRFTAIGERRFDEDSTSWFQARWRHERWVEPSAKGCVLTDRLTVEPRLSVVTPLVERVVRRLFAHRHRRLHQRFGGPGILSHDIG